MKLISKGSVILFATLSIVYAPSARDTNKYEKSLDEWYRQNGPASTAQPAWSVPAFDTSKWEEMNLPTQWDYIGVVWFRKEIDLPESWVWENVILHLGPIDDQDTTWGNGVRVGGIHEYNDLCDYSVPAKMLKAGSNVIVERMLNIGGPGGVDGNPEQMQLEVPASKQLAPVSLAGTWLTTNLANYVGSSPALLSSDFYEP